MAHVPIVDENLSAAVAGTPMDIEGAGEHKFTVFIRDGGTSIVGTILLEVQRPGDDTWNLVETYTTYPQFKTGELAGAYRLRLRVSVYSSGVAETTLSQ